MGAEVEEMCVGKKLKSENEWDFDEIVDRSHTGSMKWEPDILRTKFGKGREHLIAMWVADMDFKCPTVVRSAMEERLAHQIYGYTILESGYYEAVISWFKRKHNWKINRESILTSPGIVPATNYMIQRFSNAGDKVLIQTPVYYPFANAIRANGRRICENPLQIVDGCYQMDFEDLETKAADPRVKIAILCSPHNPVGRVWSAADLERFGKICIKHNVLVFADEIHCDLIMPGSEHTSFQALSEEFALHSIAATAASKTFNLAGLSQSNLVIPNRHIRDDFSIYYETMGVGPGGTGTLFGGIATQAAYNEAERWLEALILYLHDNFIYLKKRLETEIPGVRVFDLEGTYLAWADFNPLGYSPERIIRIIEEKAGVALDHGDWFGKNGAGFERFNIACPRSILEKALDSLVTTFN